MAITWSWKLEGFMESDWVDMSRDVPIYDHDITIVRGIAGSEVTNRVANPGTMAFYLDNSEANSGAKLGYYSPDHANVRAGFQKDMLVRLSLTHGGDTQYIYKGWLKSIEPSAGQFRGGRVTSCYAEDYMRKLIEHKLERIAVQSSKRPDQVVSTIIDNVPTQPDNESLAVDTVIFSRALHSERDEKSTAMSALQKVCQAALGYAFVKGNATDGETFVYQMRHTRSSGSLAATLDDTMSQMRLMRAGERTHNKVIGVIHPVSVDTGADTVLAQLVEEFEVPAGQTLTINLRFRDPSGAATRISAENIVTTLVADTHYKMSSVSGDDGNDMNDDLTPTVTAGGNMASIQLQNTGNVRGYINFLEVLGDGIYMYDPLEIVVESGAGDKVLSYDLYYQDDYHVAKDFVTAVHKQTSDNTSVVDGVTFFADASVTLMGYAMDVDIGDRIKLIETATGLSAEYFVNQITYKIRKDGRLEVKWLPEIASIAQFLVLNDSSYGVIDTAGIQLAF